MIGQIIKSFINGILTLFGLLIGLALLAAVVLLVINGSGTIAVVLEKFWTFIFALVGKISQIAS